MAKYEVLERSYIGDQLVEAGAIVDLDDTMVKPGVNLRPIGAAGPPAEALPEPSLHPTPAQVLSAPPSADTVRPIVPEPTPEAGRALANAAAAAVGEGDPAPVPTPAEQKAAAERNPAPTQAGKKGAAGAAG